MSNQFVLPQSPTQKQNKMLQTSNFNFKPSMTGFSPIQDKENHNSNNEFLNVRQQPQSNQSALSILQELSENVKLDESIVEDDLSLLERLTHTKWQIRRKTYAELAELFTERIESGEFQQAWLRNIVNDKNEIAFAEGLRLLQVYVQYQQLNPNVQTFFIPDLLERGSFLKQNQQSNVIAIITRCMNGPQEMQFVFSETFKKIDSKHPKVISFALQMLNKLLVYKDQEPTSDQIKMTIKNSISLLKHTNKDIRGAAMTIFACAFSLTSESFDDVKKLYLQKNLRSVQLKELEMICLKVVKKNGNRIRVDSPIKRHISDMHSLIPEKFFEVPYMLAPSEKRQKLEEFANKLEKFIMKNGEIDISKDYGPIYSLLITVLEESNILIYQEAMRIVRCFGKLLRRNLPPAIARHFFHLVLDKMKGSLSKQHQSSVLSVLEDLLIYESLSCDNFIELIINEVEQGKNMGIRIGCVKWFKEGWLALGLAVQQKSFLDDGQQLQIFIQTHSEKILKSLIVIQRKITVVVKKENNLNFKKVCQELLDCMVLDEETGYIEVVLDVVVPQSNRRPRTADNHKEYIEEEIRQQLKTIKDKQTKPQKQQDLKKRYQTENNDESIDRGSSVEKKLSSPLQQITLSPPIRVIKKTPSPQLKSPFRLPIIIDLPRIDRLDQNLIQRFSKEHVSPPFSKFDDADTPFIRVQEHYTDIDNISLQGQSLQGLTLQGQASFGYNQQQQQQQQPETIDLLQLSPNKPQRRSHRLQIQGWHEDHTTDLLNLQQFISPLSQIKSSPMQDTIMFTDLTKQMTSDQRQDDKYGKSDHAQHLIQQMNYISQMNESYRTNHHAKGPRTLKYERVVDDSEGEPENQTVSFQYSTQNYKSPPQPQFTSEDIQRIYKEIKQKSTEVELQNNASMLNQVLIDQSVSIIKTTKRNECIKHLQEILLTSTSLYFDIASTLLQHYEQLTTLEEKTTFVEDLKLSIINETLLQHISETNYAVIMAIVLRLCTAPATQAEIYSLSEDSELTQQLQLILDVLLRAKNTNLVLANLFRVFNDHLPLDISAELTRNERMMLRLTLKCIERLIQASKNEDIDVFSLLVEIYKFFKFHPPENLIEGIPSLKELEFYFRQMKSITDKIILWSPVRAKDFVDFIYTSNRKSIYLDYLKCTVDKMLTI